MKIWFFLIIPNLLKRSFSIGLPPVANPKLKICKDCKYFMADVEKCAAFSTTDLVTGEKTYKYASTMRDDKTSCGTDGIHFEQNHFKIITAPYYFVKKDWGIIFFIVGIMITTVAQTYAELRK